MYCRHLCIYFDMLKINAIQSWKSRSFISLFSPPRVQFKRRSSLWSQNLTYCSMVIKFANNSKALFLSVVSCSQCNRICVVKSNVCLLHKLHCLRNCFILPILMIDDNIVLKFEHMQFSKEYGHLYLGGYHNSE